MNNVCKWLLATAWLALAAVPAMAAVRLVVGPTMIVDGDARAAGDITVLNQKLAFALAVNSPVPYGVPRGALVDIAAVQHGVVWRDRAVFADFIPNNWSAWPNTYQHINIVERGPKRVVIVAVRDWGKVTITTRYTLRDNADRVEIETTMDNGGASALPDLLSGLTYWPKGGFLFGVPGAPASGDVGAPLAQRTVAYDEDWSVALHAAYFNHVEYGAKDLYLRHTLAPGQSRRFSGWLQVGASGDLAPVMAAEITRRQLAAGDLAGTVRGTDGQPLAHAVVVAEHAGQPYGWTVAEHGGYRLPLPAGEYTVYATAKGYGQSAPLTLTVKPRQHQRRDFGPLSGPGRVRFQVSAAGSGEPLDARIAVTEGQQPLVGFLGKNVFFTELDRRGHAELALAPGAYRFDVSAGGVFLNQPVSVTLHVAPGSSQAVPVALTLFADPAAHGWYGADLHHHADQAEAVTPPADLARAQLAAGLDLLFVSDHDSMVNLAPLQRIADSRAMPFIGAMELSPSWAHFNVYPLAPRQRLHIDMASASASQIFAEARRLGATVIQLNHPFIPYGYFTSELAGLIPGGFDPQFDLVEINAATPGDDVKVLQKLWAYWNQGRHYYLAGGTDTHDVWKEHTGRVRTFVHVDGKLDAASYTAALQAGHAYVSYGPLIDPDRPFGDHVRPTPGQGVALGFGLQALAGIKRVELIGAGAVVDSRNYDNAPTSVRYTSTQATPAAWYALVVEDGAGRKAYSNPIWIDATGPAPAP